MHSTNILAFVLAAVNCQAPTPPPQLDWRDQGVVLPVPEPKSACGDQPSIVNSLDAISAKFAYHGDPLVQLSRQQIYDCITEWCPCDKIEANASAVYEAIQTNNLSYSLEAESDYPYTEKCDLKCNTSSTVSHYYLITWASSADDQNKEEMIIDWIQKGPLVVNVNNDCDDFKLYTSGVLATTDCKGAPNHSLLLVGYGTDQQSGQDFWIARNSWGAAWGEQGYVRLLRNNNTIGIGYGFVLPV